MQSFLPSSWKNAVQMYKLERSFVSFTRERERGTWQKGGGGERKGQREGGERWISYMQRAQRLGDSTHGGEEGCVNKQNRSCHTGKGGDSKPCSPRSEGVVPQTDLGHGKAEEPTALLSHAPGDVLATRQDSLLSYKVKLLPL